MKLKLPKFPPFPYTSPLITGILNSRKIDRDWLKAARAAGLTVPAPNNQDQAPPLSNLTILSSTGKTIEFHVNPGKIGRTARNIEDKLDTLLAVFGASQGNVTRLTPGTALVTIGWEERASYRPHSAPYTDTDTDTDQSRPMDLNPLRIDLDNAGAGAYINLTTSCLIGGASESGKSNTVWHLLSELNRLQIPYRLSVIDPAGGVELNDLEQSSRTEAYVDNARDVEKVVTKFRADMYDRFAWMKAQGIRTHLVTEERPLKILVIDELLLCADQLKGGAVSPMGDIISVGRKGRYIVWACSQLGQKDVIGSIRDLFPQRACLRTKTQEMTDAILGSGATGDGAKCHRISRPGQGYVFTDQTGDYQSFQAPLIRETLAIANGGIAPPTIPVHTRNKKETNDQRPGRTFVYQLYDSPTTDIPCYVGISNNPRRRFAEHRNHPSGWFDSILSQRTEIREYSTREQALKVEALLIQQHNPKYNVQGR